MHSLVALAAAIAALPAPGLPASFIPVRRGPEGGSVWIGRIPNREVTSDHRASAVYLPPRFSLDRRYPVVYLLHGMRGAPSSFYASLRIAVPRRPVRARVPGRHRGPHANAARREGRG